MSRAFLPDLSTPLVQAIVAANAVTALMTGFKGSFPVFSRRPAEPDAPFPMIFVSEDIAIDENDWINDQQPLIERDVSVYGKNNLPAEYRVVETIARQVRLLFDRQRLAISLTGGWHVVQIWTRGPFPAPVDEDKTVGRRIPLRIQLARPS